MKKLVIASLTAMFVLTGCNTFKGLGQDVESAGNAVTDGAQDVQNKIPEEPEFFRDKKTT